MKNKTFLSPGIYLINKRFGKNKYYHFFSLSNYTIIVPVLRNNKFLIVSQKRIPIRGKNFEFPAGLRDKGETSIKTAERELLEETGYKNLSPLKKIANFYPDPGRVSNKAICFLADNLKKISKPEKGLKLLILSKKQIISLINKRKFNNGAHIAAFYKYLYKKK